MYDEILKDIALKASCKILVPSRPWNEILNSKFNIEGGGHRTSIVENPYLVMSPSRQAERCDPVSS